MRGENHDAYMRISGKSALQTRALYGGAREMRDEITTHIWGARENSAANKSAIWRRSGNKG